jgi:hypothetical protein
VLRAAAVLLLAGYVLVYAGGRADHPIRSDGFSYYVYLPSWFLFHDPTLASVARDCCGGVFPTYTAIIRWPGTRRWVNAHPIGVAVMQAPVFFLAHALTRWTNLSPDGFTFYYQHGDGLSGLLWTCAGLFVLRRLLRRHFSETITAVTLASILLGTNLYHYGTFDSSFSHAYSFFLLAAFLDLTDTWYARPRRSTSVLLGVVAGLIVLTRHTNALFVLFFPLYALFDREAVTARFALFQRERRLVGIAAGAAALVILPQLAIYYQATGRPIISSYGSLGFYWEAPRIAGVLVSVQKGLFFWSPLLILACVGLALLARSRSSARAFLVPAVIVLALDTYVIASWWDWQFGASFGHRAFVDTLPIFAIGLATCYEVSSRRAATRRIIGVFVVLCVALNLFQMLQYWNGVLPMSDTTWDQYRGLFLKWR